MGIRFKEIQKATRVNESLPLINQIILIILNRLEKRNIFSDGNRIYKIFRKWVSRRRIIPSLKWKLDKRKKALFSKHYSSSSIKDENSLLSLGTWKEI